MTLSRNQKYEQSLRERGLVKLTIWVPANSVADFKAMAFFCVNNKETVPFMARSLVTGRMAKAV